MPADVSKDTQLRIPLRTAEVPQQNLVIQTHSLMSNVNRRLYAQCGVYRVKLDIDQSPTGNSYDVYTLANTWWVRGSIRAAKKAFYDAMKEELGHTKAARWHDFRINHNIGAQLSGTQEALAEAYVPGAGAGTFAVGSSLEYSQVEGSNSVQSEFVLTGATASGQWNVFEEYDKMGNPPQDPAAAESGGYANLTEELDEENVNLLQELGNTPPYLANDFNNPFMKASKLYTSTTGAQVLSTGWIDAPLGLLFIPNWTAQGSTGLTLHVARGNYKGAFCDRL